MAAVSSAGQVAVQAEGEDQAALVALLALAISAEARKPLFKRYFLLDH